jgi:hypothetical protein
MYNYGQADAWEGCNMLTNPNHRLQRIWRRLGSAPANRSHAVSAAEPTKLTWAKRVDSFADVPEAFKSYFEPYRAAGGAFPYTVLTPAYPRFLHRTNETLTCVLEGEVDVLERSGSTFTAQCYPLAGISSVEVRAILLDYSFQITGVTSQGLPACSNLRCNAVTDYLFTPILERIRLTAIGSKEPVQRSELEKFEEWVKSSYKFMNYARRSLLGGEKVIHTILQPEFQTSGQSILGKLGYRKVSPALACILTDCELIVIRDFERERSEERYGGIWDYVRLDKIAAFSVHEEANDGLVLSVQLPASAGHEFHFQAAARRELEKLLELFRELSG